MALTFPFSEELPELNQIPGMLDFPALSPITDNDPILFTPEEYDFLKRIALADPDLQREQYTEIATYPTETASSSLATMPTFNFFSGPSTSYGYTGNDFSSSVTDPFQMFYDFTSENDPSGYNTPGVLFQHEQMSFEQIFATERTEMYGKWPTGYVLTTRPCALSLYPFITVATTCVLKENPDVVVQYLLGKACGLMEESLILRESSVAAIKLSGEDLIGSLPKSFIELCETCVFFSNNYKKADCPTAVSELIRGYLILRRKTEMHKCKQPEISRIAILEVGVIVLVVETYFFHFHVRCNNLREYSSAARLLIRVAKMLLEYCVSGLLLVQRKLMQNFARDESQNVASDDSPDTRANDYPI